MTPRRFSRSLTISSVALSLTVTLLTLVDPGVAQGDSGPCLTGGAVEDVANNPGLVSDCATLLAARDVLAGEKSLNWSAGISMYEWEGVGLSGSPLRVTALNLENRGLTGQIPADLAGLSNLREIGLSRNELSGRIPPELGDLTDLHTLRLGRNLLDGPIPAELGNLPNLAILSIFENRLTGPIPVTPGNFSNLEHLTLNGNQLTGPIPVELSDLANLEWLDLGRNQLTGQIPSELANLSNLEWLLLDNNLLTGPIPPDLGRLVNLRYLNLRSNQLTGQIPRELGSIDNLESLNLPDNQLQGPLPEELGNLVHLRSLILNDNPLAGEIPTWLGRLSNLHNLWLESTELIGEIPSDLGKLDNLISLNLGYNRLSGPIPTWVGTMDNLQSLSLRDNQLTGEVPSSLAGLSNLLDLWLGGNQLTGSIPRELGSLNSLRNLILGRNQLTGSIPRELGSLSNLQTLYLSTNLLTGTIPIELAGLSMLRRLSLFENMLSGQIPSALGRLTDLRYLELADNRLTGEIPEELGQLKNLARLYVGGNDLTGCLPPTLSQLDDLQIHGTNLRFCFAQDDGPPTVTPSDLLTVGEGLTLRIEESVLLANDIEREGYALRVTEVSQALNGTVSLDGTTITYVHDGSETTSGGFTYAASDGASTETAMVTVAVTPMNDPPVAVGDTAVVDEGDTLLLKESGLLANDSDAEDGALEISAVDDVVNGTVLLDGTTITYVHDGSETTSGGFTYAVSDGVDIATATVTIAVTQVNDPPVAVGETALLDEGETLAVKESVLLANDSDAEGDALEVSAVGGAVNGAVSLNGATITYVHDGSETTSGGFTYAVSDGVDIATATVTITIRLFNDPPDTVGEIAAMDEGDTLVLEESVLLANDSDAEGEALSVSAVGDAVNGTVSLEGTTITYVHDGSETDSGNFRYTVSDGETTSTAIVMIAVRPVNDPPVAVGETAVMDEEDTLVLEESVLLSNDSDAEGALKVSGVGEAVNGTVRLDGTTITYVHDGSETTSGGFAYTVSDGVDTATATLTITIRLVNDPPVAVDDTAAMDEGDTLVLEESVLLSNDSDAEGDTLNVSAVGDAVNGTVSLEGTTITYVHDGSETTSGGFTYAVSDGVDAAAATVSIAVRPVNDPPVAVGDTAVMDEGDTVVLEESVLLSNDSDAEDALKVSGVGEAVNGTVKLDGTTITYVHDGSETTGGAFAYTVSDGVHTATASVTITIRRVNAPPTAVDDTAVVDEGDTLLLEESVLLSNDSDAEGDTLNVSAVGDAMNGTVKLDGARITFVHDGSETSTGGFTYTVSDGVDTATATVTFAVRPVNDPPTANSDSAVMDEGGTFQIQVTELLVNDSDAEGDTLNISAVGDAMNGTVKLNGARITFVHDGSETSTGGFTYTVSDGVDTATATVTFAVRPVNDPPTANSDSAVMDEGGTFQIQVTELLVNDSDAEGDTLNISAVGDAVNGTVRLDGTTITYVHEGADTTSDGFTYTVSDGEDTATASVTITVRPVNDLPVVPLILLALGVALVTAVILAVLIAMRRRRRVS